MNQIKTISPVRKKANFEFISGLLQGRKSKPQKFKHSLKMPFSLYSELTQVNVLDPEDLYCNEVAFFSFTTELISGDYCKTEDFVTISFISLFQVEDLHRKIDHYLVTKFSGFYPIERFGTFF